MIKQHLATAKLIVPFDSRQLIRAPLFDFYEGWLHCASTPRRIWLILSLAMNLSNKTKWLAPYLQSWVFNLLVVCWFRLRRISKLTSLIRLFIINIFLLCSFFSTIRNLWYLIICQNGKFMYLNSFVGVRCEILPKVLALWCFHLSGPASCLPDVCVFPKLFCNYLLFTFIIISSDYRCFHFTSHLSGSCLVSAWCCFLPEAIFTK